jgi:hypothetical protein
MDYHTIITELSGNTTVFNGLLAGVPRQQYLWRPAPEKWCLLEIVCHLYDEEREDFRARTKHVLESPTQPLPPIDPAGWVLQRRYMEQDYDGKVQQLLHERQLSVEWLRSLHTPVWHNAYLHPKLGYMTAKMLLCNWLAHDHLHFRQITRIKYQYLQHISGETLSYAGEW